MLYYYSNGTLLDAFIYRNQTNFLDYFFLFPFWIGLILIIEVLPYFLASDILQIITKLFFSNLNDVVRKWSAIFKIVLVLFFSIYVTINTLLDTYKISESEFKIKINNLPDELDNLNLALIADLQVDRFTQNYKINGVKKLIRNIEPDLLFFAGDLVTRGTYFIEQGIDVMCDLQANTERVACIGDHDYWADAEIISSNFINCGWTFLNNAHRIINYKNTKILVTGVTYIYSQRISSGQLTGLLENAPQADLKILLVHQPSKMVIKGAEEFGYDILLAGHTHGGQVVFKPFGFSVTPTKFENEFYSGQYKKNNLNIFITNGIGLTMMPLRYRAPAEVIKIILQN
jgi:predicted MPP superfamily phosphohydrolase